MSLTAGVDDRLGGQLCVGARHAHEVPVFGALPTLIKTSVEDRWGPSSWLQPAWRAVAAEVALADGAFLDMSSGYGWVCIHVAAGKPELDAVGIEPCPSKRNQADKNRQRRLNCTFKEMDLKELTFPDSTFDVALAIGSAQHWAEPDAVLTEVHRVMRQGARLLLYDPQPEGALPTDWIDHRGAWPPESVVRRHLRKQAMDDASWERIKLAVKASPFGGGEEGQHGFYRRLVMRRTAAPAQKADLKPTGARAVGEDLDQHDD
jgi:ubiquinone/menaquinone biosynthesis C-methylase UbiE